jgi:hypothetical protein
VLSALTNCTPFAFFPDAFFSSHSFRQSQVKVQHNTHKAHGGAKDTRDCFGFVLSLSSSAQEFLSARARNENRAHFAHGRCGAHGEKENGKYKATCYLFFTGLRTERAFVRLIIAMV